MRWSRWSRGFGLAVLVFAGCAQPAPEASVHVALPPISEASRKLVRGTLAAVEIPGHPQATVLETVESVFTAAGFRMSRKTSNELTFDRLATRMQVAAYGNWFGTDDVYLRLKVDLLTPSSGVHLLRCRSFVAREGGLTSEDEQPLARRKAREYEDLLYEVARRLI